jgi:hypothetical protein
MCRTSVTKDKEAGLDVSAPEKQVHPEKGKGKFAFDT